VERTGTDFVLAEDEFGFDYDSSDVDGVFQKVPANSPVFPAPKPRVRMKVVVEVGTNSYEIPALVPTSTSMSFVMPRVHTSGNSARDQNWTKTADLRITPLDASGVPIVADELLISDAITLGLPKTGRSAAGNPTSPHSIVTTKLVSDLRSFVQANTRLIPHFNYEKATVTTLRPATKLPALVLNGPEAQESRLGSKQFQRIKLEDGTRAQVLHTAEARDLVYDLFILDDSNLHGMDMANLIEVYVNRTQYFVYSVMKDGAQPLSVISYLSFDRIPGIDNVPALLGSSIRQGRARLRITSVPVGYYSDPAQSTILSSPDFVQTDIIHNSSASAADEQPDSNPGIIEG
jgi:hypothetical protein